MKKVFISYCKADRKDVEKIAQKLKNAGIYAWYDRWEIRVGDSIIQKINDGIGSAEYLIVVLSKASVKSTWVREELSAAIALLESKGSFILPVLLEDCDIPPLLVHRCYVNYRNDPEGAIDEIIQVIRGLPSSDRELDLSKVGHDLLTSMILGYSRMIDEVPTEVEKAKIKGELMNKISFMATQEEMSPAVLSVYVDRMLAVKSWLTISEFALSLQDPKFIASWSNEVAQAMANWMRKRIGLDS